MSADTRVLFLGSPYWCHYLRDLLGDCAGLRGFTSSQCLRWLGHRPRAICLVGLGPADSWKRRVMYFLVMASFRLGVSARPVTYWIGSDVLRLTPGHSEVARSRNLAGSEWLAQEVRDQGYACATHLFPVRAEANAITPLPADKRLQVLCYVPDQAAVLHGGPEIIAAATRCEQMDVTVVGGTGAWCDEPPDNVTFVGWVDDINTYIASSHVVLRRTQHDSLSALVREALLAGRHVIFTYPVSGAVFVASGDVDGLVADLQDKSRALQAGELKANVVPPAMRGLLSNTKAQAVSLADALREVSP